jgi:hypothetical protein
MEDKKDTRNIQPLPTASQREGFLAGSHIGFVFKKIERLSTAIYLISNLWDEREPLKWKLRDKNLCLIEESTKYHYSRLVDKSHIHNELVSRIAEIISLLEIAFASTLLSEMNLRVIKEQYIYLIKLIEEREEGFLLLPKNFFEAKQEDPNYLKPNLIGELHQKDTSLSGDVLYKGHQGQEKDKRMSFRSSTEPRPKPAPSTSKSGDDRQETILSLIRSRGEITVKDAVTVIKGCSEKTIQRELLSMTATGILKKKGERRWSRYSLK